MSEPSYLKEIRAAADFITGRTQSRPEIGLILGSGLDNVIEALGDAERIPYREIPYFPTATVQGHVGELVLGRLGGRLVAALRGRVHYYEGYTMQEVVFPVRVLREIGTRVLVITNAAGGLNPGFAAGDLMLIRDQINLGPMAGLNPLRGPNEAELGPRFPDMTNAYDRDLRALGREAAHSLGLTLREGVYVMLAGPNFETPADARFLRMIGADAVGMSTAPEVIAARHGGQRVVGVSLISNLVPMEELAPPVGHEEVLAAGRAAAPALAALLSELVARLPKKNGEASR